MAEPLNDPTIRITSPQPNATINTAVTVLGNYAMDMKTDPPAIACWFEYGQGSVVHATVTVDTDGLTWRGAFGDQPNNTLPASTSGTIRARLGPPGGPTHSVPVTTASESLLTLDPPPPLAAGPEPQSQGKTFALKGTFLRHNSPVCYICSGRELLAVGIVTGEHGNWVAHFYHLPPASQVTIHAELWNPANGMIASIEKHWQL